MMFRREWCGSEKCRPCLPRAPQYPYRTHCFTRNQIISGRLPLTAGPRKSKTSSSGSVLLPLPPEW